MGYARSQGVMALRNGRLMTDLVFLPCVLLMDGSAVETSLLEAIF